MGWSRQNVDHFNGAVYKKFINLNEANDFKYGYKYKETNKEKIVIPKPKLPYSKLLNIYTDEAALIIIKNKNLEELEWV